MVCIYNRDYSKSYIKEIVKDSYYSGTGVYNNSKGQVVLTESWTSTITNVNLTNNTKTYLDLSLIEITNCQKFNGKYISDYIFDDNYVNKKQKKLVVYYSELRGNRHIKVTYLDYWDKVIIESAK
jgi:hypothetical protein